MIETIISNFWEFMIHKGWTQTQAAAELGITQAHLSRVLHDKRTPSIALLKRMEQIIEDG